MPTNYNWPLIQSGETLQALVNTLLRCEIPGSGFLQSQAGILDRNARSSDKKTIFQYQRHTDHPAQKQ